jgi:tetratricopeptide (TPR) repeat protein
MDDAAHAAFERAAAHDRAGQEAEAIPEYEEALRLGLDDTTRPKALVGLGSSLRNVQRYNEAVEVLGHAVEEYPDHSGLRFFLALAQRSGGAEREAFLTLGRIVLDEADLGGYDRAAALYLDELD